jgi:hypothetical protein
MLINGVDGQADDLHAAAVELRFDLRDVPELGGANRRVVLRIAECWAGDAGTDHQQFGKGGIGHETRVSTTSGTATLARPPGRLCRQVNLLFPDGTPVLFLVLLVVVQPLRRCSEVDRGMREGEEVAFALGGGVSPGVDVAVSLPR